MDYGSDQVVSVLDCFPTIRVRILLKRKKCLKRTEIN